MTLILFVQFVWKISRSSIKSFCPAVMCFIWSVWLHIKIITNKSAVQFVGLETMKRKLSMRPSGPGPSSQSLGSSECSEAVRTGLDFIHDLSTKTTNLFLFVSIGALLASRCGNFPTRLMISYAETMKSFRKWSKGSEQRTRKTMSRFLKKWCKSNAKNCIFFSLSYRMDSNKI